MSYKVGLWKIDGAVSAEPTASISKIKQVHGAKIINAHDIEEAHPEADGILLNTIDDTAVIYTADCLPLVLMNSSEALALHISRKTLIRGLLEHAATKIKPENIQHIFIGPHICQKHFSFEHAGAEIIEFQKKFPEAVEEKNGNFYLSLIKAVETYFKQWVITAEKITRDPRCTYESPELPSYKRWLEQGKPGQRGHLVTSIGTLTGN